MIATRRPVYYNVDMFKSGNSTRDRLINHGLKALLRNGYDGIGLSEVLATAKVPKGSFYHFFESKEAFVVAVVDAYESRYVKLRSRCFGNTLRSPLNRLKDYFDELKGLHMKEKPFGGCLFGVLAQTATLRSSGFKKRLSKVFLQWDSQLEAVLREAQEIGELRSDVSVRETASFLIDAYEGALLRMKLEGTPEALSRFRRYALDGLMA